MGKAQILIVEDDAIVALSIQSHLQKRGYDVSAIVASGEEAIEKVQTNAPDLVLMDIRLKGEMNGIEAAARIHSKFKIPVVYLTAYAEEDLLEQSKKTEPYGYIIKPFQDRDLNIAVEIALYKHKIDTALQKSEERFRNLFEQSNDAIFIHTLKGQILDANAQASEMLGYPKDRLVGLSIADLHPKESLAASTGALRTVRETGAIRFESKFKQADGAILDVEISSRVIDRDKGIVQGIVRDITDRKRAEKKEQNLQARMQAKLHRKLEERSQKLSQTQSQLFQTSKLALLGEMATGIAHEINQPLAGISLIAKSFDKLMERGKLSKQEIECGLRDIKTSVNKITKIIQHIRAFARQDTLLFVAVDVNETIVSALGLLREQLRLKEIEVELKLQPALPKIQGEPYQLEQVWINLIANARDAVDEKQKHISDYKKRLKISTIYNPDAQIPSMEVRVADNGNGLPGELKEKIFEPFFTTKEVGKGTGLGLSISYGIIQSHNGKIEVESSAETGTTFRVILPASITP